MAACGSFSYAKLAEEGAKTDLVNGRGPLSLPLSTSIVTKRSAALSLSTDAQPGHEPVDHRPDAARYVAAGRLEQP